MGVSLAKAETIKKARDNADKAAAFIEIFEG